MFSASISSLSSSKSTPFAPSLPPTSVRFRPPPPRVSAAYDTAERTISAYRISTAASLYEVLGIHMGATCHEIKTAYRRLARVLHPDVASNGGKGRSADEFIRIHGAYSTLSDPEKRANYDRNLFRRLGLPVSKPFAISPEFSGYTQRRTWETDQCW